MIIFIHKLRILLLFNLILHLMFTYGKQHSTDNTWSQWYLYSNNAGYHKSICIH